MPQISAPQPRAVQPHSRGGVNWEAQRKAFLDGLPIEVKQLMPGSQHYDADRVKKLRALKLRQMLSRRIPQELHKYIPWLAGSSGNSGGTLPEDIQQQIGRLNPTIQQYIQGSRFYSPNSGGDEFDDLRAQDEDVDEDMETEIADALQRYLADGSSGPGDSFREALIRRLPSKSQRHIPGTSNFDSELAKTVKEEKIKRRLVRNLPEKLKKYAPASPFYDGKLAESDNIPDDIKKLIDDLTPQARKYIRGSDEFDDKLAAKSDVLPQRDAALFQLLRYIPGVNSAGSNNVNRQSLSSVRQFLPNLRLGDKNAMPEFIEELRQHQRQRMGKYVNTSPRIMRLIDIQLHFSTSHLMNS